MRFTHPLRCVECGETWVLSHDAWSWIISPKKVAQILADMELSYQLHVTNHKLERIEAYVKENGL